MSRRVRGAIAQLSAPQREAFVLYELEGLPGEQIARILGCPIGTVWTRLHYARMEFQRAVEEGDIAVPRTRRADAAG